MCREDSNRRRDGMYAFGAAFCVLILFSFPYLLSRVEMPGPAQPIQTAPVERASMAALGGTLVFRDPAAQSREFMGYYHTIELTPAQEAIKKEVLGAIPAACCSGSTAYTCCCPCNLSKTIWGLSNYVIAKHGADAKQLRGVVDMWMAFVNPDGFRGNACYQGGCESRMSGGGCGAMSEEKLAV
jgi:hypothetical protein